jgi:acylphosphatase
MDKKVRAHAIISGRVQGVFFRMETKRSADQFNVFGWVRNRRDGTVEAVFEGDKESVEAVLKWCHGGPPHAVVKSVDVKWMDYAGEFKEFKIAY